MGRFDYMLSMFVPGSVSALAIFVVMKSRRHIVISSFIAAVNRIRFLGSLTPLEDDRD